MYKYIFFLSLVLALTSCSNTDRQLPILGPREPITKMVDGKSVTDTLYHRIPTFSFTDQNNTAVSNKTFDGKIYVADFFFTTCPTICPKMKTQMLRIYEQFKGNTQVGILSHTIDPRHDSVAVLHEYSQGLGVKDNSQWHFVTGDKDKIYEIGQKSYMVTAVEDATEPGGIVHSGAFILVDKQRHIRGIYDGTRPEAVDKLMKDMTLLLNEKK
jgi:protein SCO1